MQLIILVGLLCSVTARSSNYEREPIQSFFGEQNEQIQPSSVEQKEPIAIIKDDRVQGDDGSFSYNVETANGIVETRSGGLAGQQGSVFFNFPNGEKYTMKFVANENGFQPESSHLPVAPEFPHEIPEFVIEQIVRAEKEDAEKLALENSQDNGEENQENTEYNNQEPLAASETNSHLSNSERSDADAEPHQDTRVQRNYRLPPTKHQQDLPEDQYHHL